jgi:hypothetical protein
VLLVALVASTVLTAGCSSDDDTVPNGTTAPGDLVFGEGELPGTVPADFPIPAQAVIGSTLVDPANDRTEVVVRVAVPIQSVAQFYDVNLVNQGYVIDGSAGDSQAWVIEFRRDGLEGTVTMIRVEQGITQYSVELLGS